MNNFLSYRRDIDSVDKQIITLLQERSAIVQKVKMIKDSNSDKFTLYIKPDREHQILSYVTTNALGYSKKLFYNCWRGIVSASNFLEQDLHLLATSHNTQSDIHQHFGMQKTPTIEHNAQKAFTLMHNNTHHILAFKANDESVWNILKQQTDIKVFAETHTVTKEKTLLCGKINVDPSAPALAITTQSGKFLSKGIYTTHNFSTTDLGYFYPLVI